MNVDKLTDEWNQYCLEDIKEECYQSNDGMPLRVAYYWSKIELIKDGVGHAKYPTILSVFKAALTLAHGNSEIERGFSGSGKTVTVDRTHLSKATLNNLQIAADGLEMFGSLPHHVPVTSSFIKLGQSAHKNYCLRVDDEKKKEAEKRKQEQQEEDEKKQIQEKKKKLEKETDQVKSRQVYILFS